MLMIYIYVNYIKLLLIVDNSAIIIRIRILLYRLLIVKLLLKITINIFKFYEKYTK